MEQKPYYEVVRECSSATGCFMVSKGIDASIIANIDQFLEDYGGGGTKVSLWENIIGANGGAGIEWKLKEGILQVLFYPNNQWYWHLHTIDGKEAYGQHCVDMEYNGEPSFQIEDRSYFSLPEEVEKFITIPDNFEKSYQPIIEKYYINVIWVTNKWDGMLSGYVKYKDKLHYADCVDETDFTRSRMFAIYDLTWYERLKAWISYFKWSYVIVSRPLWWIYMKTRSCRRGKNVVAQFQQNKQKFINTHKIVGYYSN